MKLYKIFIAFGLFLIYSTGYTQVAISDNVSADPDPASILDLQSSTKGFLTPRMTESEKNLIPNPPTSLIIYQTDGTAGFYYNIGTPAAPQWNKLSDNTTSGGGLWTQSGSDIYYNTGNVGIGNSSPGTNLDVSGPGWFQDSLAIDGSPGKLYINAASGFEPAIRLAQDNATIFKLRYRIGSGTMVDPYFMLNSNLYTNIWGVTNYGRVRQDYKGSFQAYLLYSTAPRSALFIDNDNNADETRCINATISSTSSSSLSISIGGWNNGAGSAVYGANGSGGNFGYLGTESHGAYGENGNAFWGALGAATAAVYGQLGGESSQALTDGDFAVKGLGARFAGQEGSDYDLNSTVGGVVGYNTVGTKFSFGVAGYTATANEKQSGAVLGSLADASIWGSLAYRTSGSGNRFAGYFTSLPLGSGSGKASMGTFSNIGIGVWGDLIGANIKGSIYGLYAEGADYSIYAHGDVYRTGADVHVQTNAAGENSVMYTLVSTEMVVQTYGIGQMTKGKSNIVFDQAFADVVSTEEPIIVTITPIGKTKGVYLDEVDGAGFRVGENSNGKSDVQFSWIAIGKRKGFENITLPEDVIASDYNDKMHRGLANDNDPGASAEGLYYKDGKLYNGQIQQAKTNSPAIVIEPAAKKSRLSQEVVENIEDIKKN